MNNREREREREREKNNIPGSKATRAFAAELLTLLYCNMKLVPITIVVERDAIAGDPSRKHTKCVQKFRPFSLDNVVLLTV